MGAGGRSESVGSIDEPDSSAWLSVCGVVSVCRFGFSTLPASKRSKFNIVTALGNTYMYENCREKGTGMVGVQTVVYMRCAANQRNVVRQSNYALKAINGGGNDIIA